MVNEPLIRPYFFGGTLGGGWLISHKEWYGTGISNRMCPKKTKEGTCHKGNCLGLSSWGLCNWKVLHFVEGSYCFFTSLTPHFAETDH